MVKGKGIVLKDSSRQTGFYINASVNDDDTSRIRPGQIVWLLLKKYPAGTWGRLNGRVQDIISADPNKGNVIVQLQNNGLVTERNRSIPFEPGLSGEVFIVVKDISLLQRIL